MLQWYPLNTQHLQEFLKKHGFHYMFFNSYIYKPYLKRLDKFGLCDLKTQKLVGVAMIEKIALPNGSEKNVMHVAFLPSIRGKEAQRMGRKWLSEHLGEYKVLEGHVPKRWPKARVFAKWFNFKQIAETPDYFIVELRDENE